MRVTPAGVTLEVVGEPTQSWSANHNATSRALRHIIDCVIESSLREIIGSKNFALINLSLNFSETTIYDKVFLENLVAVH